MKEKFRYNLIAVCVAVLLFAAVAVLPYLSARVSYPRPYRETVLKSGLPPALVYAVIKAESDFREDAVSRAGAVGLMQLMPATAEFVCERDGAPFDRERLKEAEYNITLGCKYLTYLFGRFPVTETAICAYNAGEGTVSEWLRDSSVSEDGKTLNEIPYGETRAYVKKILKYRKMYEKLYR